MKNQLSILTEGRLREILSRQVPRRFNREYMPSIKATKEEAPRGTRPSQVPVSALGRSVQALSTQEKLACALALYHPALFDLHEQHMLPYLPESPHPLHGHPRASGDLPKLPGTLQIAELLGALGFHPLVRTSDGQWAPFCWIGDFLLFIQDDKSGGRARCVNWSIKARRADFEEPFSRPLDKKKAKLASERERARHLVEKHLFESVGIPTCFIAVEEDLSPVLLDNLFWLLLKSQIDLPIDKHLQDELVSRFRECIACGVPPLEVMVSAQPTLKVSVEHARALLCAEIWARRIRVDLFTDRLFVDRPWRPERRDPLVVHQDLFAPVN